jgi:acyl carrier protein
MSNLEKYKKAFVDSLSLSASVKVEKLEYQAIDEWDSIGHMTLMSELEDTFSITIDTDDIVDFGSFEKGKEILKKYKIKF